MFALLYGRFHVMPTSAAVATLTTETAMIAPTHPKRIARYRMTPLLSLIVLVAANFRR
jgi:hypothetical protein